MSARWCPVTKATALACMRPRRINYDVIPEVPFYIGPVARVRYLAPGSDALARAVVEALRKHDMALLENHGQVTVAKDFDHAIQNAVFFELACQAIVLAGPRVRAMPASGSRHLLQARRRGDGKA